MTPVVLCFFAIFAVILTVTVKQLEPKFAGLVVTAAGLIFWLYAVRVFLPVIRELFALTEDSALSTPFSALFRALGLSLVISFSAGVCRDLGENGIAEKLELCGKGAILTLAVPLLKTLLNAVSALLS